MYQCIDSILKKNIFSQGCKIFQYRKKMDRATAKPCVTTGFFVLKVIIKWMHQWMLMIDIPFIA